LLSQQHYSSLFLVSFCWFFEKKTKEKVKYFGATEKLYVILTLSATSIYSCAIWAITPQSNPVWIKSVMLGMFIGIQIVILLFFSLKKITERPDERFFINLAKAASLTLFSLAILAIVLSFFSIVIITPELLFILISAIILIFAITFNVFENRGT